MSDLFYFNQTFVPFPSLSYLLTPCCFISFVTLSIFRRLTLCYLLTFYVIYTPYKCTYCTHHKHNPLSRLIVRTLSAPIDLSNSPGVFGHRAILTLGGSDRGWGFPHRTNRFVLNCSYPNYPRFVSLSNHCYLITFYIN